MSQDTQQAGEEVRGLRMRLANALTLAARAALDALLAPEDRGQKFPDFTDNSRSHRTLMPGWIVQVHLVIRRKPASMPDLQSKLQFRFNHLRRVAVDRILLHIWHNGDTGLEDNTAYAHLLEAAVGDPD